MYFFNFNYGFFLQVVILQGQSEYDIVPVTHMRGGVQDPNKSGEIFFFKS